MQKLYRLWVLMWMVGAGLTGLHAEGDQEKTQYEDFEWSEPFSFIQLADCQLGMFEENQSWDEELRLLEQAVEHINRLKPRFVVVCGDMTHAMPGEECYKEQVIDFKRVVQNIDENIPLVCVCGNHDVGNVPTRASIESYREAYGEDYFTFWVGGVEFFVLNSSIIYDSSEFEEHYDHQRGWLEYRLRWHPQLQPVHRIAFLHHPIFLEDVDEEDSYFNLPIERRKELLDLLTEGGVKACFSGHYHQNAYTSFGEMELVTTSAVGKPLGDDPSGLRIVWVHEDRLEHEYYGLDEVPKELGEE